MVDGRVGRSERTFRVLLARGVLMAGCVSWWIAILGPMAIGQVDPAQAPVVVTRERLQAGRISP
jgi:hypothetical protein